MKRLRFALGLLVACAAAQQPLVAKIVLQKPKLFQADPDKLLLYARKGNLKKVKEAIAEGANVNMQDRYKKTPLHFAAYAGNIDVVAFLISEGAVVNSRSNTGQTPLHFAAYAGHTDVVAFLLSEGAVVDSRNSSGYTPLHSLALFSGNKETARLLLKHGANVYAVAKDGRTPAQVARTNFHYTLAEMLDPEGRFTPEKRKAIRKRDRAKRKAVRKKRRREFGEKIGITFE